MALPDINFSKDNTGAGLQPPGNDHISGFVYYKQALPDFRGVPQWSSGTTYQVGDKVRYDGKVYEANTGHTASSSFSTDSSNWDELTDVKYRAKKFLTLGAAEDDGITEGDANFGVLWYHMKEFWRIQTKVLGRRGPLWVFIGEIPGGSYDFQEIKSLQDFAEGELRQTATFVDSEAFATSHVLSIQTVVDTLFSEHQPLDVLHTADFSGITDWSQDGNNGGVDDLTGLANPAPDVSVIIGQDGDNEGAALYQSTGKTVSCIGAALGALSSARVNESIAWVGKFPLITVSELQIPALANGDLYKNLSTPVRTSIDDKRYIFLRKHVGKANTFFTQSHVATPLDNKYNYIELERTFHKATRRSRAYLLDELNAPVLVDPDTGQLDEDYVEYLKGIGEEGLDELRQARELSGAQLVIDPTQNVKANGKIKFSIEMVSIGVSREFDISVSYVESLS